MLSFLYQSLLIFHWHCYTSFWSKRLSSVKYLSINTPEQGTTYIFDLEPTFLKWVLSTCPHSFMVLAGSCILQFWNYSSASKPCKCPMCACKIVSLMPEASLQQQQDQEVTKVLKSVQRYNLLFVGGVLGYFQVFLLIFSL